MKTIKTVKVPGTLISSREHALDYVHFLTQCLHEDKHPAMAKVVDEIESRLVKAEFITWQDVEDIEKGVA